MFSTRQLSKYWLQVIKDVFYFCHALTIALVSFVHAIHTLLVN
jgi:hypothetical protein